jgi:hypothetical protein
MLRFDVSQNGQSACRALKLSASVRADLLDAAFDLGLLARAVDHGGVVLVDHDSLGAAEVLGRDVLEFDAELLGDH